MSTALERVKDIGFGTAITAPVLRYHPALVAQAFATMQVIHGPRVILGVGTGEAMNEVPLGFPFSSLAERRERLVEAVEIMRKLWRGGFVDYRGKFFTLKAANLYMKASIPIFISGFGPKAAKIAGTMGDGFITGTRPLDYMKNVLFRAVEEGAKSSGKNLDDISKVIELDVSYDKDYDVALASLRSWGSMLLNEPLTGDVSDPREIEELGRKKVTDKQLVEAYVVGTSAEEHIKRIEEAFSRGFDHVYVFSASPNEEEAIKMYGKEVLPYFNDNTR
jgi:coenzyme F420-dependent glucose-6-phosphate dehydrogenase